MKRKPGRPKTRIIKYIAVEIDPAMFDDPEYIAEEARVEEEQQALFSRLFPSMPYAVGILKGAFDLGVLSIDGESTIERFCEQLLAEQSIAYDVLRETATIRTWLFNLTRVVDAMSKHPETRTEFGEMLRTGLVSVHNFVRNEMRKRVESPTPLSKRGKINLTRLNPEPAVERMRRKDSRNKP